MCLVLLHRLQQVYIRSGCPLQDACCTIYDRARPVYATVLLLRTSCFLLWQRFPCMQLLPEALVCTLSFILLLGIRKCKAEVNRYKHSTTLQTDSADLEEIVPGTVGLRATRFVSTSVSGMRTGSRAGAGPDALSEPWLVNVRRCARSCTQSRLNSIAVCCSH